VARYEVFIKPSALKELEAVGTRKLRRNLVDRIEALADDPRPQGCAKLAGGDRYRVRCGAYRIVYSVEDERRIVLVVKIGHRKDVCR
jgi:mRNA interferase RelE/StbE